MLRAVPDVRTPLFRSSWSALLLRPQRLMDPRLAARVLSRRRMRSFASCPRSVAWMSSDAAVLGRAAVSPFLRDARGAFQPVRVGESPAPSGQVRFCDPCEDTDALSCGRRLRTALSAVDRPCSTPPKSIVFPPPAARFREAVPSGFFRQQLGNISCGDSRPALSLPSSFHGEQLS